MYSVLFNCQFILKRERNNLETCSECYLDTEVDKEAIKCVKDIINRHTYICCQLETVQNKCY